MYFKRIIAVVCIFIFLCFSYGASYGEENVALRERYFSQHDLCESEIAKAEKKYGIPYRLLMAIGTVESGRSLDARAKRAWPWTICAAGKSYYFSTKSAAIATVKRLMSRGIRNIDVGCMQVNLLHHSQAFKTLEEAFTPKYNVSYAAKFFVELKNTYNSWTHAVGYYHSKAAKYYRPYCSVVYNTWAKVRNRPINESLAVQRVASEIRSQISFLPSYYSLIDTKISAKLHQLGRKTIARTTPKFFVSGSE
ncbi:MAG: transglycosylase SLT domain-containing protein [Holosporaceae bacterium]|nr:transglycosylase SLT domain-containing protein [Holosporaceae bacterium]